MKFIKDMKSTPSQHASPCNGNGGYPLPTRARIATGDFLLTPSSHRRTSSFTLYVMHHV